MTRADAGRSAAAVFSMLLACGARAFALNPTLDVSQYAHTSWKIADGFTKGAIRTMAQGADGYIWLGTEFGLLRFDGVRAVAWEPPTGERLPSADIRSLLAAHDASLWIGTYRGLVRWDRAGLTHYPLLDGQIIEALVEDRDRTMWVVAGWTLSEARLCRIDNGNTQCYGESGGFGARVTTVYEDSRGRVWTGGMGGVAQWKPGNPRLYPIDAPAQRTYALVESDDGGLLVARHDGILKMRNGSFEPYLSPPRLPFTPIRLLRDRDGGLWIGAATDEGLLHVHAPTTDLFRPTDGLSGGAASFLFEDREGNIWAATESGLDRFRDVAIPTFSVRQGLSSAGVYSVLATKDGSIWFATSNGLTRRNNDGHLTIYRPPSVGGASNPRARFVSEVRPGPKLRIDEISVTELPDAELASLFNDSHDNLWVSTPRGMGILKGNRFEAVGVPPGNMLAIAGDTAGNVWISHDQGLFHLHEQRVVDRLPWASFGRTQPAASLLDDRVHGGLWIGFREGGVAFFKDGQVRASFAGPEGLGGGIIHSFYSDGTGAVWAATEGGLSRINDGHVLTMASRNGLPCDSVHWIREGNADSVWMYTVCGLLRLPRSELNAWISHPDQTIRPTVFDTFDGVNNHPIISGYSPIVAKAADGRLWFLGWQGVSVIDERHLVTNKLPPPVYIEQLMVDGKTYPTGNGVRLPPRVRDVWIDYTALSFVAPEKVRFRYLLEGQDRDWKEVVNHRQAQYSNLGPGSYRFRVVASNNRGVWNETGATLEFSIEPAYYQTRWFAALLVAGAAVLLAGIYELRAHQLAQQFNRTLEARVSERTRIARDLHDTLLQSFQGALLRFQSVANVIKTRPDEASERLNRALDQAEAAIAEGRNAVQGLRTSAATVNDLANGIAAVGAELTSDPTAINPPIVEVTVASPSRNLNPVVRDEAYRIASEALRNAVKHADAHRVNVTLYYDARQFRLTVHDDGKGMDAETIARQQKAGHFGLPGMRERATIVKGRFELRSAPGAGTEIELSVPAAIAYSAVPRAASWWRRATT